VVALWISPTSTTSLPWWGVNVRKRVGMRHHTLAEMLNAFIRNGLVIEHVGELGDRPVPNTLAIRACREP
jgi:hypothetical protein